MVPLWRISTGQRVYLILAQNVQPIQWDDSFVVARVGTRGRDIWRVCGGVMEGICSGGWWGGVRTMWEWHTVHRGEGKEGRGHRVIRPMTSSHPYRTVHGHGDLDLHRHTEGGQGVYSFHA